MDDPGKQARIISALCIKKYNHVVVKYDQLKLHNSAPLTHIIFST